MSLVIWSGRRWRSVSRRGSVEGWRRRARIVAMRDGVLREISFKEAMRRLRRGAKIPLENCDADDRSDTKITNKSTKSQMTQHKDVSIQTDIERETSMEKTQNNNNNNNIQKHAKDKENKENVPRKRGMSEKELIDLVTKIANNENNQENRETQDEVPLKILQHSNKEGKGKSRQNIDKKSYLTNNAKSEVCSTTDAECHELLISEQRIDMIRSYLEKHALSDQDLYRFDCDEKYQHKVLYSLNPLVLIERNSEMERLQRRLFASTLGLKPVPVTVPATVPDVCVDRGVPDVQVDRGKRNIVNRAKERSPVRENEINVGGVHRRVVSKAAIGKSRGAVPRPTKNYRPNGKEYSSLEDHAIVSWLSASSQRESAVNGNAVWRELQSEFERLTGTYRSWHSLRNRYLRYILPSLGFLALPQEQMTRMRAKAAMGTLKARRLKKQRDRRNSLLAVPPVRSAFAAAGGHSRTTRGLKDPTGGLKDPARSEKRPRSESTHDDDSDFEVKRIRVSGHSSSSSPVAQRRRSTRTSVHTTEHITHSSGRGLREASSHRTGSLRPREDLAHRRGSLRPREATSDCRGSSRPRNASEPRSPRRRSLRPRDASESSSSSRSPQRPREAPPPRRRSLRRRSRSSESPSPRRRSLRPREAPSPARGPSRPPEAPSPLSYGEVTRRFALRHRPIADSSDDSILDKSKSVAAGPTQPPRTRRLYNPKPL